MDDLYYRLKTFEGDTRPVFSPNRPHNSAFVGATSSNYYAPGSGATSGDHFSAGGNTTSSKYFATGSPEVTSSKSASYVERKPESIVENMLYSFVAESDPDQKLTYDDFSQIDPLDLEELDIKWQYAMISVRQHKFEQKANRKICLILLNLQGLIRGM